MSTIAKLARVLALGAGTVCLSQEVHAQANDWPCEQRLVPKLEPGQMWSGPPLAAVPAVPPDDVSALTQRLTVLHQTPEALAADVQAFADGLPADQRSTRMSELFAAALDRLNSERALLIGGIKRYAQNQQRMAGKISAEMRELEKLRQQPDASSARIEELQSARDWDTRVFTDRQRELRLVCEQPVLLEQRAFALARLIQDKLK